MFAHQLPAEAGSLILPSFMALGNLLKLDVAHCFCYFFSKDLRMVYMNPSSILSSQQPGEVENTRVSVYS